MMKVLFYLPLIFIACSKEVKTSNSTDKDSVKVVCYNRNNEIEWESTKIFKKYLSYGRIAFDYLDTSAFDNGQKPYRATLFVTNNKDSIDYTYFEGKCYLRTCKDYNIENKKYRVYKYITDFNQAAEIYTNDSLGLIRVYSLEWGKTMIYIKDSITNRLNKELSNDTTLFVRNKNNHDKR